MAWNYPLTFGSKEPFCTCVVSTLSDRVFSFLCPCHDYSLEVRDKNWLFTQFLLAANSSTGAHLSPTSYSQRHRRQSSQTSLLNPEFGEKFKRLEEGSGNTLQYSCLENPVNRGAWWVAVRGVAQSRTRLK